MKSSTFIKILSTAYLIEAKTVGMYARLMKEEGLLTTGARGVNAPHMHPRDAVRLTIALLSTGVAAHAVERYKLFAPLPYSAERSWGAHPDSFDINVDSTFEGVLLRLFTEFPRQVGPFSLAPYVEVSESRLSAAIEHAPVIDGRPDYGSAKRPKMVFALPNKSELHGLSDGLWHGGILVSRGIHTHALNACATPFQMERQYHVSWETIKARSAGELPQRRGLDNLPPEKGLWHLQGLEGQE